MSVAQDIYSRPTPAAGETIGRGGPPWRAGPRSADIAWAAAFLAPYVVVLLGFVVYPLGFAFWLGSDPSSTSGKYSIIRIIG